MPHCPGLCANSATRELLGAGYLVEQSSGPLPLLQAGRTQAVHPAGFIGPLCLFNRTTMVASPLWPASPSCRSHPGGIQPQYLPWGGKWAAVPGATSASREWACPAELVAGVTWDWKRRWDFLPAAGGALGAMGGKCAVSWDRVRDSQPGTVSARVGCMAVSGSWPGSWVQPRPVACRGIFLRS